MKTLTEFSAMTLKSAAKTKQELTAAGKTAEELPVALGEALKLEGDKLTLMLAAVEMVENKFNDLKRVVVFSLAEGEKAPQGTEVKAEKNFMAEYYPPMQPKGGRPQHEDRGRGGRGGKGGRGGGRDDKKRGGGRGERGPRRDAAGGDSAGGNPGGRRPPRDNSRDNSRDASRGAPTGAPRITSGPPKLPVPLAKPLEKPVAAPQTAPAEATVPEQKS